MSRSERESSPESQSWTERWRADIDDHSKWRLWTKDFGYLFLIGGLWAFLTSTQSLAITGMHIVNAQTTTGTVVHSEVVLTDASRNTKTHPNVTYRYTVNGQNYTSNTVFPGRWTSQPANRLSRAVRSERATQIVEKYESGKEITVHYLGDEPSRSYLIVRFWPMVLTTVLFGVWVGAILWVAGIEFLLWPLKRISEYLA